jgi:hypothetical protein
MRSIHHRRVRSLLRAVPILLLATCVNFNTRPPPGQYRLVQCGRGNGATATAEVGPAGGRVAVGRNSLHIPPQAVNNATAFRITELDSAYVGVEVQPHGTVFNRDATLTLSYARCGGFPQGFDSLYIVQVNPGNNAVMQVFSTSINRDSSTVSTSGLGHLSGYLLAGT